MGHDANRIPYPMTPARYIMVGGFLGAGKTTAILRLAEAPRPPAAGASG